MFHFISSILNVYFFATWEIKIKRVPIISYFILICKQSRIYLLLLDEVLTPAMPPIEPEITVITIFIRVSVLTLSLKAVSPTKTIMTNSRKPVTAPKTIPLLLVILVVTKLPEKEPKTDAVIENGVIKNNGISRKCITMEKMIRVNRQTIIPVIVPNNTGLKKPITAILSFWSFFIIYSPYGLPWHLYACCLIKTCKYSIKAYS